MAALDLHLATCLPVHGGNARIEPVYDESGGAPLVQLDHTRERDDFVLAPGQLQRHDICDSMVDQPVVTLVCASLGHRRSGRVDAQGCFPLTLDHLCDSLGWMLGKWTAEYWSGEVFYEIYFRDRNFWVFNLLRANCEPDTLREISTWYSRQVVVVETVVGLGLWLLPPRWAAAVGVLVLTSIAVLSNWLLFSVLSCLIGLAAVGFLVPRATTVSEGP